MNYARIGGLIVILIGLSLTLLSIRSIHQGKSLSPHREPIPNGLVGDLVGRPLDEKGVMVEKSPLSELFVGIAVMTIGGLVFYFVPKFFRT